MAIQSISTGLVDTPVTWTADWAWGLPLIVVIVLLHILGLATTREAVLRIFNRSSQRHPTVLFVIVTATATFLVFTPSRPLFGLLHNVLHTNVALDDHWQKSAFD